jgi:hypothetical protein
METDSSDTDTGKIRLFWKFFILSLIFNFTVFFLFFLIVFIGSLSVSYVTAEPAATAANRWQQSRNP